MDIKKHIVTVIIGLALSFAWGYLINLGKEQKVMVTNIELLKVANINQDEKLKRIENSYVPWTEFNRTIEDQKKLLEKIDQRLEKLTDKFYNK